jgi:signal transduction histidine kinase/ligand-binding sensor domain-containing protein/CheY-like chemotaxis protein/AraC-like DNA-binding protein
MKRLFALTLSLLVATSEVFPGSGDTPGAYILTTITVDDGLPHHFVDDIFKDSRGFIWISTRGGLSRHDGHEFVTLDAGTSPIALKSNTVKKAREDRFQRLWVISSGGADLLDLVRDRILPLPFDSELHDLLIDSHGDVWLRASNEIFKISLDDRGDIAAIDTLHHSTGGSFTAISEIDSTVLVALNGKIYAVSNPPGDRIRLQRVLPDVDFGGGVHVSSILKQQHLTWIGTENGLARHDGISHTLDLFVHDDSDPASISQNMITDLLLHEDQLIVATLRGLNFFDSRSSTFRRLSSREGPPGNTLGNDFVNCVFADRGTLWIATEAGGVNKLTPPRLVSRAHVHDPTDPASISANPVNAIYEDTRGNLWVGTVEGGLNRKAPGCSAFDRFTAEQGYIPHNSVSALTGDRGGRLWVGTWGGGVAVLDISGKYPGDRGIRVVENIPLATYTSVLHHDTINDAVWIGTSRGVHLYDLRNRRLVLAPLPDSLTVNIRGTLGSLIDRQDRLWIGTTDGLLLVHLRHVDSAKRARRVVRFRSGVAQLDRFFFTGISSLLEDQRGNIWIGSQNHGLCKLPADGAPVVHYTTADGLPNHSIFGILEDARGAIWISTARGISTRDPDSGLFTNYTRDDGLPGNLFYLNASCKSSREQVLYFGGVNGLVAIEGKREIADAVLPPVALTRLLVIGKVVAPVNSNHLSVDVSRAARIDLHESDKSFSIEFSALDHDHPSTVAYAYRLEGFDSEWTRVDADRRFASYTNLPAGAYTFQVKRAESPVVTSLRVVVHPFFYKTAWFITAALALVIGVLLLAHRRRVMHLRQQGKMLQEQVARRTRTLEEQKQLLEMQSVELQIQNNTLKIQHDQLLDMARQVKQSTDDRVNFFTNISHEFRTLVTLISGPVARAMGMSFHPPVIEQLDIARRNAEHLLALVNQLMDFRKIEEGHATVHLENKNFLLYLDEILAPFNALLDERNLALRAICRLDAPVFLFDQENTRKLLANLLANAIKFTPDGGTVTLYAKVLQNGDSPERLYIAVSDTGPGIKQADLQRVFERFFQSRADSPKNIRGQSGTGIGLYLCKSIVELLGGTIAARNNPSRGASVRVILPLTREPASRADEGVHQNDSYRVILVVEDNADARLFITSVLRDHYRVEQAADGEQALHLLSTRRVDLVISDLVMPVMDGLELSRRLKGNFATAHIPFIMLTARGDTSARLSSYESGVDDYIEKPFTDEFLLARVRNILQRREADKRRMSLNMSSGELNIPEGSNDERFLRCAINVLKENYQNERFDVSDFASAMNISKSVLNKRLQTFVGCSVASFIRDYRLNVAREMIRVSRDNLTISEIAYSVGFSDPKYFSRCFLQHFGITPTAARDATSTP